MLSALLTRSVPLLRSVRPLAHRATPRRLMAASASAMVRAAGFAAAAASRLPPPPAAPPCCSCATHRALCLASRALQLSPPELAAQRAGITLEEAFSIDQARVPLQC